MNKTVTINLSGIIFHIDEDAYGKLHGYLNTIRGYFSESEGRDEIMADIENRIAEMLSEKISDRKQVVLMMDVDHVINVMGKPEDFAGDNASQQEEAKKEQPASAPYKRRRVFRDSDNKILGGVCSGVANYFNIDPLWLRLALVAAFFAFGTGFLLYIVLWIVIPEAKTTAEKLEMRGEDVNFSNIGKKVEEEMHSFGKKMENWGSEVKNSTQSQAKQAGNFFQRFFDLIGTVFGSILRIALKIFAVFFILLGLVLLVSMFSSMFGGTGIIHAENFTYSIQDFFESFFVTDGQMILGVLALTLFVGVPLIMLVYNGFRLLLGIKAKNRFVGITAGVAWGIGWVLAILSGINVADQFADNATAKQTVAIAKTKCDTLYLRVKELKEWNNDRDYHGRHMHFNIRKRHLIAADSINIYFGFPALDIVRGEADSVEVVIYNEAYGADKKEALHFARNINYELSQKDSLIEFMPYFSIPKEEKWRAQNVHIEIRVPKGKTVYLSKSMRHILNDVKNESETYDGDMVGRHWIMSDEELRCVNCEGLDLEKKKRWKKRLEEEFHSDDEEGNGLPADPGEPAVKHSI